MSKANSTLKVLKTAYHRVQTRWGKGAWNRPSVMPNESGKIVYYVCLEGAIMGGNTQASTVYQQEALELVGQALFDLFPERVTVGVRRGGDKKQVIIPNFNDARETTQDEILEAIKLAIIRVETEALMKDIPDEDFLSTEEMDNLIENDTSCMIEEEG